MDRLIKEALAHDAAAGCPDAEVIASYVDRRLSRAERTTIDAHLARCARCRAQVALVIRAAAAAAEYPEDADARSAPVRPFLLRRWPWLASAAAATLAIAVWVAVEREPEPPPAENFEARAMPDQKAPAGAEPAPAKPGKLERFSEGKRREDLEARSKAAPPRRPAESGRADMPARERAAAAPAAAEAQDRVALLADAAALPGARSPDGRIWWRVTAAGTIERSEDAGAAWVAETGVGAPGARALSAPASDVCWIAGQRGLVLVFHQDRGWSTATPPATVDLIAVSALDGSRATVTASDGRRFTTTDGGLTWRPMQEN